MRDQRVGMGRTESASTAKIKNRVIQTLEVHPSGLRSDQIRKYLAAQGEVLDLSTITMILAEIQQAGTVIYKNRHWTLTARPKASPSSAIRSSRNNKIHAARNAPDSGHKHRSVTTSSTELVTVGCLPFSCHFVNENTSELSAVSARVGVLPDGWSLLRRLVPYWRECLRAEERPSTILPLERVNVDFCGLTSSGEWWPTERRRTELAINAEKLPAELLQTLARGGTDSSVFLGYPLQLIPGSRGGGAFARPIFTFACQLELSAGVLRLSALPQPIDVNADWLEKQFRNGMERQSFLRWLGIANRADEEGDEAEDGAGEPVDLPTAAARLAAYLKTSGDSSALSPTALATSLPRATDSVRLVNVMALFAAQTTRYSKGTLTDLARIADWSDEQLNATALRAFFANMSRVATSSVPALPPVSLSEEQLIAARSALNEPLTVITGPPGTGKSQVVAAIMASAALTGRTVVLASKNHKALDAVEQRLAELLDARTIVARASQPYGSKQVFSLRRATEALFARGASTGAREKLVQSVARLRHADDQLLAIETRLERQADLSEKIASVEAAIEHEESILTPAQQMWVRRVIPQHLPELPTRFAKITAASSLVGALGRWLRVRRCRQFLTGLRPLGIPWSSENDEDCLSTYEHLAAYHKLLKELETVKQDLPPEAETAALTERLVSGRRELFERTEKIFQSLPTALEDLSDDERLVLADFVGSMAIFAGDKPGAPGGVERRRTLSHALPILLRHFPLWAVTNLSAARALPLEPGLFDYVVIDEASQCDIASAIPLLARARQVVVVGDPAQLRHITKCSQEREVHLLETHGLLCQGIGRYSYRNQSLFNFAAATPGVMTYLLRDHYRCARGIADYFNSTFYGGRLRVLTDENQLQPPPGQSAGIHWTDIQGSIQAAATGCHAPAEVDAILAYLRRVLIEQDYRGTIGIVTPFREQAKRLSDRIIEALPPERVARSQLGAFTAHQFQGDARDLILLSLCLGPDMPTGSRSFLAESENLMNVAVSRARAVCHVFGNRNEARRSGIKYLVELSAVLDRTREPAAKATLFESPWEERLYHALKQRGLDPIPQFPIAGRRLDLAILRGNIKLDVEVDGDRYHRDPSGRRKSSDLWRDHQLRSLGWHVKRYWVYQLRENLDGCLDDIIAATEG